MSETILITGASGTLGRRLTSAARDNGWRVRALVHRSAVGEADELVSGSLLDRAAMRDAVHGCAAVLHLGGTTHARRPSRYFQVNLEGTRTVVDAAEDEGVGRFLFASSRAISTDGGAYSRSKARAEEVVVASRLGWTIVRLPELYGGGGSEGVDRIVSRAAAGARIPVVADGSQEVCPLHIDDAVEALVQALAADAAIGKTYTLAGECTTVRGFAEACRRAAGSDSRIVEVPAWVVRVLGELGRLLPLPVVPDQLARLTALKPPLTAAAAADLTFAPRSLERGLPAVIGQA